MRMFWEDCYVITYSTQKKNSLEPALFKTEYVKGDPMDYFEGKKASDINLNFSLIYCESITKKQYKKFTA